MHRATAIVAALAPALVLACHPHLERRGPVNAARGLDRSSEAAEALITDAQTECSYYSYPPANEIVSRSICIARSGPRSRKFRADKPRGVSLPMVVPSRPGGEGVLAPAIQKADRSVTDQHVPDDLGDGGSLEPVSFDLVRRRPPLTKSHLCSGISAADRALFASINSSVPNIPVRGNRYGDFSGIQYDKQSDPDCWWSSTHCVTPKLPGLLNDTVECDEANTWGLTLDDGKLESASRGYPRKC